MDKQTVSDLTRTTDASFPIILKSIRQAESQSDKSLFKQDTDSSQGRRSQQPPNATKLQTNDYEEIRKFMKKGDAINSWNYHKLKPQKRIAQLTRSDKSVVSLYKFARQMSLENQEQAKDQKLKKVYLSNPKKQQTNRKSWKRGSLYVQTKHKTIDTQIQTDLVQNTQTSNKKKIIAGKKQKDNSRNQILSTRYPQINKEPIVEQMDQEDVLPKKNRIRMSLRANNSINMRMNKISRINNTYQSTFDSQNQNNPQINTLRGDHPLFTAILPQVANGTVLIGNKQSNQGQVKQKSDKNIVKDQNDNILQRVSPPLSKLSGINDLQEQHQHVIGPKNIKNSDIMSKNQFETLLQTTTQSFKHQTKQCSVQYPQISKIQLFNNEMITGKHPTHPVNDSLVESNVDWISHYKPRSQFLKLAGKQHFKIKKYKNGVYFGQIDENDQKHGKGIIFYFNGRTYQGSFQNDTKNGKGCQLMPDGSKYTGQFKVGLKQGMGKFQWPNGQSYDGQWVGGKKNGSGIWKGIQNQSYIGQWKNGQVEGFGVFISKQGDRYQGQFRNSLKHGLGTQRFKNKGTYVGNYHKNRPDGQGQYYWTNGDFYKGDFSNGLRHGFGTFKDNKNGLTYTGQYRNDKKCGYGQMLFADGTIYVGNFENDFRHGYGQLSKNRMLIYKGYWVNDQQIQQGMMSTIHQDAKDSNDNSNNKNNSRSKNSNIKNNNNNKRNQGIIQRQKSGGRQKKQGGYYSPAESISVDDQTKRACGCQRKH